MAEFALAVPFLGLVEKIGVANDLPPHVTVLIPAPGDVAAIADALEPFDAFEVTFERLERFPETLWLAPEPKEPFVAMTEALMAAFPGYLPYGGVFEDIVPHLAVAQSDLDETAKLVEPLLPLHSRVESVVLYELLYGDHWHDVQTFGL